MVGSVVDIAVTEVNVSQSSPSMGRNGDPQYLFMGGGVGWGGVPDIWDPRVRLRPSVHHFHPRSSLFIHPRATERGSRRRGRDIPRGVPKIRGGFLGVPLTSPVPPSPPIHPTELGGQLPHLHHLLPAVPRHAVGEAVVQR